jgi:hypothetical protein
MLGESRKARGLPSLETAELQFAARAWEKALRDVPAADLQLCYDRAIADYTEPEKPFGTPQLLRAWQLIVDERRRTPKAPMRGKLDTRCPYCNNTGYQHLLTTGKRKVVINGEEREFEGAHTSVRPCACVHAPAGQRSDFPMREPLWEREPAGRWWVKVEQQVQPALPNLAEPETAQ